MTAFAPVTAPAAVSTAPDQQQQRLAPRVLGLLNPVLQISQALHAGLSRLGDQVTLAIEDNGCGFDSSEQVTAVRGTRNMRERMEKIGGTFTCHSAPGQGTIVTLTAPLKP